MTFKNDKTRREVLLECLEIIRQKWRIASKSYNCLEPKAGMEIEYYECMKKAVTLQKIIQALESEAVRAAIAAFLDEAPEAGVAKWQQDIMDGKQGGLFAEGSEDHAG